MNSTSPLPRSSSHNEKIPKLDAYDIARFVDANALFYALALHRFFELNAALPVHVACVRGLRDHAIQCAFARLGR